MNLLPASLRVSPASFSLAKVSIYVGMIHKKTNKTSSTYLFCSTYCPFSLSEAPEALFSGCKFGVRIEFDKQAVSHGIRGMKN